jgi:nucleoid DNA-binding protein
VKKDQLAKRLAIESGISAAAAADQLDGILVGILRRVRQGRSASLPGLGTFLPGPQPEFYFEQCLPVGARRSGRGKGSQ